MKDKRKGMVKYMYLMPSVIKAMHIIPRLTICDYNEKITVDMLANYSTSHYSTIVYITALYKNSKAG